MSSAKEDAGVVNLVQDFHRSGSDHDFPGGTTKSPFLLDLAAWFNLPVDTSRLDLGPEGTHILHRCKLEYPQASLVLLPSHLSFIIPFDAYVHGQLHEGAARDHKLIL